MQIIVTNLKVGMKLIKSKRQSHFLKNLSIPSVQSRRFGAQSA